MLNRSFSSNHSADGWRRSISCFYTRGCALKALLCTRGSVVCSAAGVHDDSLVYLFVLLNVSLGQSRTV